MSVTTTAPPLSLRTAITTESGPLSGPATRRVFLLPLLCPPAFFPSLFASERLLRMQMRSVTDSVWLGTLMCGFSGSRVITLLAGMMAGPASLRGSVSKAATRSYTYIECFLPFSALCFSLCERGPLLRGPPPNEWLQAQFGLQWCTAAGRSHALPQSVRHERASCGPVRSVLYGCCAGSSPVPMRWQRCSCASRTRTAWDPTLRTHWEQHVRLRQ